MSEKQITDQLKKAASDVLTEDTMKEIEESFNESVNTKAEELVQLRVEKALIEQDEEHAVKLEKLLEAIDTDHTKKLQKVVEAIDKNHSEKLVSLVERFRSEIDGDAKTFKESLVTNISDYLDLYVEKVIPTQDIQEAVKNKHAVTVLEGLRKALSVDNALSNTSVREAVIDGKKQIDEANHAQQQLAHENKILKENLQKQQAELALDKLTEGLPSSKKRHMHKVLAGKSAQFINENFQYTLDMFEKNEKSKLSELKEQATTGKQAIDRPVTKKPQVVAESVEQQIEQQNPGNKQDKNLFNNYMGELGKW